MRFPCKDCITLPICKAHLNKYMSKYIKLQTVSYLKFHAIFNLRDKCTILDEHYYNIKPNSSCLYDEIIECI